MLAARFIDVGVLEPLRFHATYSGLAEAQSQTAAPIAVWGRTTPHICLGQAQDPAAELASGLDVPIVRRPLGGGAVWVDESQYCVVLIAPCAWAPRQPAQWFAWALNPVIATYRSFGLEVTLREQDLWIAGRKIAGSGAATLGGCAVIATSFMLHFPAARFARCIASPSLGFHRALVAALATSITDWESHAAPPRAAVLQQRFRSTLRETLGWRARDDRITAAERRAIDAARDELADCGHASGRRLVPGGIKLNAARSLAESAEAGRRVRRMTVEGRTVSIEVDGAAHS